MSRGPFALRGLRSPCGEVLSGGGHGLCVFQEVAGREAQGFGDRDCFGAGEVSGGYLGHLPGVGRHRLLAHGVAQLEGRKRLADVAEVGGRGAALTAGELLVQV